MKAIKILALVASFVVASQAQALDGWQGTRYIHSTTTHSQYMTKLTLDASGSGEMVTREGSAPVFYSVINQNIEVTPKKEISYERTGFVLNNGTGQYEEVVEKIILLKTTFGGDPQFANYQETWQACPNKPISGATCYNFDVTGDRDLVVAENLRTRPIQVVANDRVVLPLVGRANAFVQLEPYGAITTLDQGDDDTNMTLERWSVINGQLHLTFTNGTVLKLSAVADFEGVTRVMGVSDRNGAQRTVVGALAIDRLPVTSGLGKMELSGLYKTVLTDTINDLDVLYEFGSDGLGGFETMAGGELWPVLWAWDEVDGMIVAKRYRLSTGPFAETESEVRDCHTGKVPCDVWQTRTYKILNITGNRYNMVRMMSTGTENFKDVSVWTFYKQ